MTVRQAKNLEPEKLITQTYIVSLLQVKQIRTRSCRRDRKIIIKLGVLNMAQGVQILPTRISGEPNYNL